MKVALSSLLCPLLLALSASARLAQIYLTGHQDSPNASISKSRLISPAAARLLFAQRLDVSEYHSLDGSDDATLQAVSDFGGKAHKLFEDEETTRPSVMIVVEDVEDVKGIMSAPDAMNPGSHARKPSFEMENSPDYNTNSKLMKDFSAQVLAVEEQKRGHSPIPYSGMRDVSDLLNGVQHGEYFHNTYATFVHIRASKSPLDLLSKSLDRLFAQAESHNIDLILALMPPHTSMLKRSSSSYGSYSLPARSPARDDRITAARPKTAPSTQDEVIESIVSPTENLRPSFDSLIANLAAPNRSHDGNNKSNNATTSPHGILPVCFPSISTCRNATHSCSGHGTCVLKYNNRDGDGETKCFSCACTNSTRTNEDGTKKTTYWGGPACQKEDVSMPFWLLGGMTVLLVSVVMWGIGLLSEMGAQELPSVIGAGVAGPRAK